MSEFAAAAENYRTSISNSATAQGFLNAANAAEALDKIYLHCLPPPPGNAEAYTRVQFEALRPFVHIYFENDVGNMEYKRLGTHDCWQTSGTLFAQFQVNRDPDRTPSEEIATYLALAGTMTREIAVQYSQGGLAAETYQITGPHQPQFEDLNDVGDHLWFNIVANWGFDQI